MEQENIKSSKVAEFFENIFNDMKRGNKKMYTLRMLLEVNRNIQDPNKEFTKEEARNMLNKAIQKQLGKVGLAKYGYEIEKVSPYDNRAHLVIEGVTADEFCIFWSTLSFNPYQKISLKDIEAAESIQSTDI